ncbi:MAG: hypothetical protein ACKVX7_18770 [Planctomycetota bacterium]
MKQGSSLAPNPSELARRSVSTSIRSFVAFAAVTMAIVLTVDCHAQNAAADKLLEQAQLAEAQRKAASDAATDTAERLMNELQYREAEDKLDEALRLNGSNTRARELLDRVQFILGARPGEVRDIGAIGADLEKVKRQQAVLELQRMMARAIQYSEQGKYDEAVSEYERLLERIEWFPFGVDLSDMKTRAQQSKLAADREAQRQTQSESETLDRRAREEGDAERAESLRFVKNRIDRLMERIESNYRQKRFDEVVSLADQVLNLDKNHKRARYYRGQARQFSHEYAELSLVKRHREEWDRTFLAQLESEIPYHKIFNFPDRESWRAISLKSLSAQERIIGKESSQEQLIEARLNQAVDVEFNDRPFQEVIAFLQEITQVNFVLSRKAEESLAENAGTVRLAQVKGLPARNVLRLVLDGREPKFSYVIKSGAVLIGPADSLREDLFLEFYEVQDLTKAHPDFVAPKLALDDSADGSGGGGSNTSVLDIGGGDDESKEPLGSDLLVELIKKTLWGEEEPVDPESVEYQSGKIVLRTTIENHEKMATLLDAVRKSTGVMVTVESRFLDLQENFLEVIGVNFGNPQDTNLPNPIDNIDGTGTQISSGYEFVDAQGQTDVRGAVFNAFSQPLGTSVAPFNLSDRGGFALQYNVLDTYILEGILEANAKEQNFTSLNAPRVTAFNGQIAHSLVIDQAAYIRDAEVNQTGVIPVINPVIGILNSGSILQVRPTVSHDRKYVILEIEPTLAVQLPSTFRTLTLNLTNLAIELPVLSVTKLKTTVTVPDGGTVLVGGLKRTITQDQQTGVPWLSRLPIINILFGRKGEAEMRSNLFVLLNAKITVIRDEERKQFN